MSALAAAGPATGSRTARTLAAAVVKVVEGGKICSVIAVGSQAMLQETVKELKMPATTAEGVATSPGTARSPRRRESRSATTVAKLDMWLETATTPTNRSATPVVGLGTYRKAARRSSATGVVKLATSLSSAARRAKSTATTVANPGTWQRNAPSRPLLSPGFLVAPSFSD